MNSFIKALKNKIKILGNEEVEAQDNLFRISSKLELLEELLVEEQGLIVSSPTKKKKREHTKNSKSKSVIATNINEELYAEAVATLPEKGTTPEMQERLVNRYRPQLRSVDGLGPGIKVGKKENIKSKSNKNITVEDD